MMEEPLVRDGDEGFPFGVNKFDRATLLARGTVQDATNALVADNFFIRTRPGADALTGAAWGAATQLQGVWYFDAPTNVEYLLTATAGVFKKFDGTSSSAAAGWTADASARIEAAQLGSLLYLSDSVNAWRTWDGTTFNTMGTTETEVGDPPVGATMLIEHNGRMFAAGRAAEPDALWASDPLSAVTGKWNHVRFKFNVTAGDGQAIRALASMTRRWLAVFLEDGIAVYDTPADAVAAVSTAGETAFTKVFQARGVNCVGRRAVATSGTTLYFIGDDGIRRLRPQDATEDRVEVTPPLSRPMQPYIDRINWSAAGTSCAVKYEHYVLFAVPLDAATQPSHVLVFNERLDSWMGVWTGWAPVQFVVSRFAGVQRLCFADTAGRVNRWKDTNTGTEAETLDATFTENSVDVATSISLRSLTFGEPDSPKLPKHWTVDFVDTRNNAVTVGWWSDEELLKAEVIDVPQSGIVFPIVLPITMPQAQVRRVRRPIVGLLLPGLQQPITEFREAFLKITTARGKVCVRRAELTATLGALEEDETAI